MSENGIHPLTCSYCQTPCQSDSQYCEKCKKRIGIPCPSCHKIASVGADICRHCNYDIAANHKRAIAEAVSKLEARIKEKQAILASPTEIDMSFGGIVNHITSGHLSKFGRAILGAMGGAFVFLLLIPALSSGSPAASNEDTSFKFFMLMLLPVGATILYFLVRSEKQEQAETDHRALENAIHLDEKELDKAGALSLVEWCALKETEHLEQVKKEQARQTRESAYNDYDPSKREDNWTPEATKEYFEQRESKDSLFDYYFDNLTGRDRKDDDDDDDD